MKARRAMPPGAARALVHLSGKVGDEAVTITILTIRKSGLFNLLARARLRLVCGHPLGQKSQQRKRRIEFLHPAHQSSHSATNPDLFRRYESGKNRANYKEFVKGISAGSGR